MSKPKKVELKTRIDKNKKLVLKVVIESDDGDVEEFRLKTLDQLADLASADGGGGAGLSLVVRDFYQDGSAYDVHGLVLAHDGRTVKRHWQAAEDGSGVQHEFVMPADGSLPDEIVVGAVPRRRDKAVEPWPFESRPGDGGGLPGEAAGGGGSGGSNINK